MKEPLVVVVFNPGVRFKFVLTFLKTYLSEISRQVIGKEYKIGFESDPAIPDIHGDAVAVVVDSRGNGEEGDPAGVAVLVVGAVSVVVEAVNEHAPIVNLAS